jgi:hypothetical protein
LARWARQFLFLIGWFLKKSSPLKPNSQMNQNLVGSTYGRFFIKFAQNRMKGEQHRLFVNWSGYNEQIYRGHSIDASYQVWFNLAKFFQRRRFKCENLTDDGQRTPSDGRMTTDVKWWQKFTWPLAILLYCWSI